MAGVAVAICAVLAASQGAAHAQRAGRKPVVVAGFRPAGPRYGATVMERLPEAQRLRGVVEVVIRGMAQRPILNHDGLRAVLGNAYLVDFVDCRGAVKCVARVFSRLRNRAAWVVYGDYTVKGGTYSFRMRLVGLAPVETLAKLEFTLRAREIEDPEAWKRELSVLLASVVDVEPGGESLDAGKPVEGGKPAGRGKVEAGEPEDGKPAAGKPAAGKPEAEPEDEPEAGKPEDSGESAAPPASTAASADELTDADFGAVASSDTSIQPEERREDGPWLDMATMVSISSRFFDFQSAPDNEVLRPDGYTSRWMPKVGGTIELYPLAAMRRGGHLAQQIGIQAEYARTDVSAGGRETELYLAASYRIPVGRSETNPTFEISAGFLRHDFVILESSVDFPSVSYRGGVVGAEARAPIFTPRVALTAGAHYMFLAPAGEIFTEQSYGDSRVGGLEVGASVEIRPYSFFFVRIGGSYTRFSLEFDGDGDLSSMGAVSAQDKYMAGTIATGIFL